jgi:thiamine pyrophosphate-dependent acetolactate synthase large subunit-like protein
MAEKKTYEVLAEVFKREGVTTCFALYGDGNMDWGTTLADLGTNMFYVRHEHAAVAAACSYARKTGDVGVATVTCGPGLSQLMTALPAAVRANLPLVVFAGEAPIKSSWYNQLIDQAPLVTATGATYRQLHHIPRMADQVRDAFLEARVDRKPVVIGVPLDLQEEAWTGLATLPVPSTELVPKVGPMPPNPDDIARAAEKIRAARRIVIVGGLGAVAAGAGPACRRLAERCDALLATTLPSRGLFHDDPFSIGIAGGYSSVAARELLDEADLVIGVGAIMAAHTSEHGKLFKKAHVLHIDTKPITVSQGRVAVQSHVRGDARLSVEALAEAVQPRSADWRSGSVRQRLRETSNDTDPFQVAPGTHHPRDVVAALDKSLPLDWQVVNGAGQGGYFYSYMPRRPQEKFLTIREFGAVGNGTSYAIGVAAARPDDTVVLIEGDGGLMMHLQEIETIKRHGLNMLICVFNDGAYGSEIHKLRLKGMSDRGAVFGRPDFAAIAQGFGIGGARVDDLANLPQMISDFDKTGGFAIWDFPISDQVMLPSQRKK